MATTENSEQWVRGEAKFNKRKISFDAHLTTALSRTNQPGRLTRGLDHQPTIHYWFDPENAGDFHAGCRKTVFFRAIARCYPDDHARQTNKHWQSQKKSPLQVCKMILSNEFG